MQKKNTSYLQNRRHEQHDEGVGDPRGGERRVHFRLVGQRHAVACVRETDALPFVLDHRENITHGLRTVKPRQEEDEKLHKLVADQLGRVHGVEGGAHQVADRVINDAVVISHRIIIIVRAAARCNGHQRNQKLGRVQRSGHRSGAAEGGEEAGQRKKGSAAEPQDEEEQVQVYGAQG